MARALRTTLDLLSDCAVRAERLRQQSANVVLLTGSEVSLFTTGFFPGNTLEERLALIAGPMRVRPLIPEVRAEMNDFLRQAVQLVRARFAGRVSYASLPHEGVDWSLFDIIATDAGYRIKATAAQFSEMIRAFVAQDRVQERPVAITEFGCMTYRGGAEAGGSELSMIEWGRDGKPLRLEGTFSDLAARVRHLPATSGHLAATSRHLANASRHLANASRHLASPSCYLPCTRWAVAGASR